MSTTTESVVYLYTDHLMTNRLAANNNGIITWRWEGEAFGNMPAQELDTVSVNLRFPGQYYDSETNLHYNINRYYDPQLGRYITSDPIGLRGGLNTYGYAAQNPIRFIDPLGLETTMVCRPVNDWKAELFGSKHCFVVVWHWEEICGEKYKIIDKQYSLAANQTPFPQGTDTPTYNDDRDAFYSPGNGNEHYDIPPPDGMSQQDFDDAVTQSGDSYNLPAPYDAKWGPNSNTAADDIIEGAEGTAPNVPGAYHQNYGEIE